MALKSAHMAGLNIGSGGNGGAAFMGTGRWLDSSPCPMAAEYSYTPGGGSSNTMTSVGLLCRQYLGATRDNNMLTDGMAYLMNNLPDEGCPNIYYWYYATQVMHNMAGYEWDTWNKRCAICWSTPRSALTMRVPMEAGPRRTTPGARAAVESWRLPSRV